MSVEVGRSRPSSGLWTLVGWLRRSSSAESVASGGSTRTAASFAFLTPPDSAPPRARPPPSPPSDTYRRRLRDRDLRRDRDRGLTLQAKYRLFDAFSLPADFREHRRAGSESGPRRAAHVPGKRRAPPPPATLPRRRSHKRPAPRPPVPHIPAATAAVDQTPIQTNNDTMHSGDKAQLLTEGNKLNEVASAIGNTKQNQVKLRPERSFLKQIFDGRKRNSAADTSPPVRLLPNISELDRQAADLIDTYRLKNIEQNNNKLVQENRSVPGASNSREKETWFCTKCLKKYDSSVVTCMNCVFENKMVGESASSSQVRNVNTADMEDKEKLKVMLKEMKNSLPKRPKPDTSTCKSDLKQSPRNHIYEDIARDTPTLPIGSTIDEKYKYENPPASSKNDSKPIDIKPRKEHIVPIIVSPSKATETVVITQATVLVDASNVERPNKEPTITTAPKSSENSNMNSGQINDVPLSITSLLNPVYIPKKDLAEEHNIKNPSQTFTNKDHIAHSSTAIKQNDSFVSRRSASTSADKSNVIAILNKKPENTSPKSADKINKELKTVPVTVNHSESAMASTSNSTPSTSGSTSQDAHNKLKPLDLFARRRALINQLEQAIAKGDESAAAEAAVKLAQLKISCSVLSFSSQIAEDSPRVNTKQKPHETPETITPKKEQVVLVKNARVNENKNKSEDIEHKTKTKVDAGTQAESVKVKSSSKLANSSPAKPLDAPGPSGVMVPTSAVVQKATTSGSVASAAAPLPQDEMVEVQVWVEDAAAARGPAAVRVRRGGSLAELQRAAAAALRLPPAAQRWIVGRTLCHDHQAKLVDLAGEQLNAPFYLCLVQTDTKTEDVSASTSRGAADGGGGGGVYQELLALESQACVSSGAEFECPVCLGACAAGAGVVLRECAHAFCRDCLRDAVKHCDAPAVPCPATDCGAYLLEREVRGLVSPAELERWLERGLAAAESGARHAFHCRTPDCRGWALCEPGVNAFPCPVCRHTNCLPCKAIHEGDNCDQYQARLRQAAAAGLSTQVDEGTRSLLQTMVEKGEALECPSCRALIMKKWGCDWVRCSACKTEICWVTRGPRWGPAGRGDTSAGCRCGVDGRRCHPACTYCH